MRVHQSNCRVDIGDCCFLELLYLGRQVGGCVVLVWVVGRCVRSDYDIVVVDHVVLEKKAG